MANYEKTEWQSGDIVTSAKLNKIEEGVYQGLQDKLDVYEFDITLDSNYDDVSVTPKFDISDLPEDANVSNRTGLLVINEYRNGASFGTQACLCFIRATSPSNLIIGYMPYVNVSGSNLEDKDLALGITLQLLEYKQGSWKRTRVSTDVIATIQDAIKN